MTKLLCLALLTAGCLGTGYDAVEIAPSATLELPAFSSVQLHAWGVRADGSREDVTDLVRWRSTDRGVATVSDTGTLHWVGAGNTHICVIFYELGATAVLTAGDPVAAM